MRRPGRHELLLTLLLAVLALVAAEPAHAQSTSAEKKVAERAAVVTDSTVVNQQGDTVILPILGYTPDTGLMLGATVMKFFYLDPPGPGTRSSVFSPVFIYTLKSQTMIFLGTDLNWGGGRWHAGLVPSYQKFPDDFYGIGRDVGTEPLESYTPEQFAFEGMIERKTLSQLRLGVGYRVIKHHLLEVEPGGDLESGAVPGAETSVVSAPGLLLAWDTRDNTWAPLTGSWFQTGVSFYREAFGSDFEWTEYTVDVRGYLPLGERAVLAGQALYVCGDGEVPFYRMQRLGGDSGLRGYAAGRFIDRTKALVRTEWRSGEVWARMGVTVFAGLGDVSPTPAKLTTAAHLYTYGFGLRFTFSRDERVNIRMDFGFGNDDSGFFLSLGEAF